MARVGLRRIMMQPAPCPGTRHPVLAAKVALTQSRNEGQAIRLFSRSCVRPDACSSQSQSRVRRPVQHFHCEPQFDGCEAIVLVSVAVAFPVNADASLADPIAHTQGRLW